METDNTSTDDELFFDSSEPDSRHNRRNKNNDGSSPEMANSGSPADSATATGRPPNDGSSNRRERACSSSNDAPTAANHQRQKRYSVQELVAALGNARNGDSLSTTSSCYQGDNSELERRVRDFLLAQRKRHEKYGAVRPWGIFGLYAHLDTVRIDLEWAEDAAWRRVHGEPYLNWADFDQAARRATPRPKWTLAVIAVCTIMLVVELAVNDWKIEPLSENPMLGPSRDTLIRVGARDTVKIVSDGQWFRLFTPLVLHAGLIHYCINMAAFWFIGGAVEQSHGLVAAVILFVVPGVGGNILSAIFLPRYISVGASGGIFGLIGACVADIGLNWNILFLRNNQETSQQVLRRNFVALLILVVEILVNIVRAVPHRLIFGCDIVCCILTNSRVHASVE
jgi:membrane associated rhomboid family serine protease